MRGRCFLRGILKIILKLSLTPSYLEHCIVLFSLVLRGAPALATAFVSPSAFSRKAVVSYWRKYVHEVLVNRFGGLSLSRKSVVRLTDCPDMTLDVYRGRKTTMQQLKGSHCIIVSYQTRVS